MGANVDFASVLSNFFPIFLHIFLQNTILIKEFTISSKFVFIFFFCEWIVSHTKAIMIVLKLGTVTLYSGLPIYFYRLLPFFLLLLFWWPLVKSISLRRWLSWWLTHYVLFYYQFIVAFVYNLVSSANICCFIYCGCVLSFNHVVKMFNTLKYLDFCQVMVRG